VFAVTHSAAQWDSRGWSSGRTGGQGAVIRLWRLATVFFCIAASSQLALAQMAEKPPDTMAARTLACAPCHGAQGQGTKDVYFPRLAGKPAGYLYNQLEAFKDGRRHYPPMKLPAGVPARPVPDGNCATLRRAASDERATPDPEREPRPAAAGAIACDQRGDGPSDPGLCELPWSPVRGDGARHSWSSWVARRLYFRAARRLSVRDPDCPRSGLHADCRRALD